MSTSFLDNVLNNWLKTFVLNMIWNKFKCGLPKHTVVIPFSKTVSIIALAIFSLFNRITSAPSSVAGRAQRQERDVL